MRTIPLYLLALIVAIANTPTDIYQICAWNRGTVKVEPWRAKRAALVTRLRALSSSVRTWFQAAGGLPAVAIAVCVLALLVAAPHAHAGVLTAAALGAPGLKGYRQREADLKGELAKAKRDKAAIGETAMREGRAMTKEEKDKFLAFVPTIEDLQAQYDENASLLADAVEANEADRRAAEQRGAAPAGETEGDADAQAAERAAAAAGVHVPRVALVDKPRLGMWGRQLQAVRNFAINGGAAHTSREDMAILKPIMAAPTGMNTDVPSDGGFLVVPERSNTIIQRAYDTGVILSRVRRMPIGPGSNGMKLPAVDETSRADNSRYGGIVSGWLGQGNTLTAGKPKFREMDLKLRKVGAFVYATDEQLADAVALEAWINTYLPLELTFRTEDAFINGDGSNKPLGAINSGAAISVTRSTAGHITSDDFRAMYAKMWAPLRSNAVFLLDQSSEPDLDLLTIPIGTAGVLDPSFKAAGTVPGQKYPTYKNIPIITVEYCAALGTAGDLVMVAFDEYITIDKGGVDQAVSLHVAFLTDEAVYRFMYRVDGQLAWNATLTLKSGGTVSSVITLT